MSESACEGASEGSLRLLVKAGAGFLRLLHLLRKIGGERLYFSGRVTEREFAGPAVHANENRQPRHRIDAGDCRQRFPVGKLLCAISGDVVWRFTWGEDKAVAVMEFYRAQIRGPGNPVQIPEPAGRKR